MNEFKLRITFELRSSVEKDDFGYYHHKEILKVTLEVVHTRRQTVFSESSVSFTSEHPHIIEARRDCIQRFLYFKNSIGDLMYTDDGMVWMYYEHNSVPDRPWHELLVEYNFSGFPDDLRIAIETGIRGIEMLKS